MKAIQLTSLDGPSALRLVDLPEPSSPDSVVIRVGAAGVNFPDLLATRGRYQGRTEPPFVLGAEVAGTVVSAPELSGWQPGDRVVALSGTGGYAELVAVAPAVVARTPDALTDAEAVALVANHQTAYFALVTRAALRPKETVLVLGSAGGLGSSAIQVAKGLGARVIGVVHRAGAEEFVRSVGADEVIALREGWPDAVRALAPSGVDVVVDPVGGDAFDDAVRVIAPGGRLIVLGFAGGGIPTIKVNRLLLRNVGILGAGWGEWLRTHPGALREVVAGLAELVDGGLRPPVMGTLPLEQAGQALERLESGGVFGKIVLVPSAQG